jgi:GMP synthase-like glutamine amidotransferase
MSSWLARHASQVTSTRFFEDPALPGPSDADLVIAMGGPMSANDEDRFPWLAAEKAFLREAIRQGASMLGVCLGSQLISSAIGLQFHLETTPESVAALVAHCPDDLVPGAWVQSEREILGEPPETYRTIHELMERVLTWVTRHPRSRAR